MEAFRICRSQLRRHAASTFTGSRSVPIWQLPRMRYLVAASNVAITSDGAHAPELRTIQNGGMASGTQAIPRFNPGDSATPSISSAAQ